MDNFAKGLKDFNDEAARKMTRRLRRVSNAALEAIVLGTPVLTGCCRGNWNVSVDGGIPRAFDAGKTDKNGSSTITAGNARIESARLGVAVTIANSCPYVIPLENGWSRQKPPGSMIAQPLAQLEAAIKAGAM